ncbi:MAG: ArsR family transcriptional regulator [Desulfobacter sp.]|jgi:ArsR family transcriptional regulator|uniref:ArsR/SmtB family transcription factor n=1 Tax=Desulfobacter sp. TaxID=2294 RepID=UPI001B629B35|nr:metalloregulator ArsR/SmtB family transcription factor [Desulfobacter sp.]MBP8828854.1 ArsR family transcriptional regulator [Desulfobacter sp.]MBP9598078.1 ArsR family transcriptional regulator [Desulfobacter sp.]
MEILKQFKALSDPTRLRLLFILEHFELNVNEIVSVVNMVQSGVSRHLKILLDAGLLVSRKDGSFIYYTTNKTGYTRELVVLACKQLENEPGLQEDIARTQQCIILRKNRSRGFFRTAAPRWDRLKKKVLGDFNPNPVLERYLQDASVIADLGCGTGEMLAGLLGRGGKTLIGVDASPEMLEQARLRLPESQNLELRIGELEHLPMREQEVDAALMSMVLYHVSEPEKAIREVYRVLNPGGLFLLVDFLKHDQEQIKDIIGGVWLGFTQQQISGWLDRTGFNLKHTESYPVEKTLTLTFYLAQK